MKTEQLPSIALEFREGSSDKAYRAAIEKAGAGYVVNFAYGRRGATMSTGAKTGKPVTYEEAVKIYESVVKSKTAKGYKPVDVAQPDTGTGNRVTDRERRDTGLRPQLLNPVTEDRVEAYLGDDNWCAQEKYDGRRLMFRKTGKQIMAANRDGLSVGFPDSIARHLSVLYEDFVADGEAVGEIFHAFDLLEKDGRDLRQEPYGVRLAALHRVFGDCQGHVVEAPTARGGQKRQLLAALKAAGKEGIVFKDLGAVWTAGRPNSGGSALKCKFWASCSCVVAKVNARRSIEIALDGMPVGNVTIPPNHGIPAVGQIVEIRYLYVQGTGGSLYQPVYLGVRDDVSAEDCTAERQHLKYKARQEAA